MENNTWYRIPSEGKLGGVSAGIARHFGLETWLVRVLFVIGTLFTHGPFFLLYVILWIALPVKPVIAGLENESIQSNFNHTTMSQQRSNSAFGIVLVVLGGIFLLNNFEVVDWEKIWPLSMVALGVYLLFKDKMKGNDSSNGGENPYM
jgi:phage shock protein C